VAFNRAIPLGSVVTVEAKVSRAFKTSMEIFIDIWVEDRESGNKTKANEAIYTFVAVDDTGTPVEVPQLIPETELEQQRFDAALRRKQLSLVLAGKMKPAEATELKALFL
jgi:acyl-CoA hydrolase